METLARTFFETVDQWLGEMSALHADRKAWLFAHRLRDILARLAG